MQWSGTRIKRAVAEARLRTIMQTTRVFTIPPWTNYLGRSALLATLVRGHGQVTALLLAVPPGYATIIWPASGIAIGDAAGARRAVVAGHPARLLAAERPSIRRVRQEGCWLRPRHSAGPVHRARIHPQALPPRPRRAPDRCTAAPQVGNATCLLLLLLASPARSPASSPRRVGVGNAVRARHHRWRGLDRRQLDCLVVRAIRSEYFGIHACCVARPRRPAQITWRERSALVTLPSGAALLLLALPLGLTFLRVAGDLRKRLPRGDAKFETLSIAGEKALENRLASYGNALLRRASFIQGLRRDQRGMARHAETIRLRETSPGLNGFSPGCSRSKPPPSWNSCAPPRRWRTELRRSTAPWMASLTTSSLSSNRSDENRARRLGLNIAFEDKPAGGRQPGARLGAPRHRSGSVMLVQDEGSTPAFPMLVSDLPSQHADRYAWPSVARPSAGWTDGTAAGARFPRRR